MPRPRTHDESVRRRLLDAASEAVADRGAAGMSLRAVAKAAETTTAAVYTLFGNRDALVEAVVAEGFRRFAAHLAAARQTPDARGDLLALGMAYRANALENPHFYRVMFTPASGIAPDSRAEPTFGVLADAVARATGASPTEAEASAFRLWAYVHGLVTLELAGLLPGTPEERERDYAAALRAGSPLLTL